jgi:hypothetical protein
MDLQTIHIESIAPICLFDKPLVEFYENALHKLYYLIWILKTNCCRLLFQHRAPAQNQPELLKYRCHLLPEGQLFVHVRINVHHLSMADASTRSFLRSPLVYQSLPWLTCMEEGNELKNCIRTC